MIVNVKRNGEVIAIDRQVSTTTTTPYPYYYYCCYYYYHYHLPVNLL